MPSSLDKQFAMLDAALSKMKTAQKMRDEARFTGLALAEMKIFLNLLFRSDSLSSDSLRNGFGRVVEYFRHAHSWPSREHDGIEFYGGDDILRTIIVEGLSHPSAEFAAETVLFLKQFNADFKSRYSYWPTLSRKIPILLGQLKTEASHGSLFKIRALQLEAELLDF